MSRLSPEIISLIASLLFASILQADFKDPPPTPRGQKFTNKLAYEVLENYSLVNYRMYRDTSVAVVKLNTEIYAFRNEPTAERFETIKELWIEARKVYGVTEAVRFAGGPIDDRKIEPLMNSSAIDPAFIDSTRENPSAGLINNPDLLPTITRRTIATLNQQAAPDQVSTGWHILEFLLWGEDFNPDGPGSRPWTDYTTAPNADRRMKYLVTATELIRHQLTTLTEEWAPEAYDNSAGEFLLRPPSLTLPPLFNGLVTFTSMEMAKKRLSSPLASQSPDDVHSVFSDTTYHDLVANIEGVGAILLGKYDSPYGETLEGKGLIAIIEALDPAEAERCRELYLTAKREIEALPHPLDKAILAPAGDPQHEQIKKAATALEALARSIYKGSEI